MVLNAGFFVKFAVDYLCKKASKEHHFVYYGLTNQIAISLSVILPGQSLVD